MGHGLLGGLYNILYFIVLATVIGEAVVLVDAAIRREDAYRAAGKMTKQGWLIILTLALVSNILLGGITSLFTIVGVVAAIVYWVDVRPALKQVSGKRSKNSKNGQHMGPYGPW